MAVGGITKTTIAQACGVSLPMMIDKLIQSGVITPSMEVGKPGKTKHYDAVQALGAIIRYYRQANEEARKKKEPSDKRKAEGRRRLQALPR